MSLGAVIHSEAALAASALMQARQTILPKRLVAPGPNAEQLALLFAAAATAPDHGQLLPWRFVVVGPEARPSLADTFAAALRERDPRATPEQCSQAHEKAYRAPLLMLAVVDASIGDAAIGLNERILSCGCAVQNTLLMATALGFGSALTSGKALTSLALRQLFALNAQQHAVCFVAIGTVQSRRPGRVRPDAARFVRELDPQFPQAPF